MVACPNQKLVLVYYDSKSKVAVEYIIEWYSERVAHGGEVKASVYAINF
jgi:hypothetical protein